MRRRIDVPRIQGTDSEEIIVLDLLLSQITECHGIEAKEIDQQSTHQGLFGLKEVRIPIGTKVIINQVTSAR